MTFETPPDWPFQTLKLGEYFALARQAARVVRTTRCEFAIAVVQVLDGREVTDREHDMLIQKTRSIVFTGEDLGDDAQSDM
ncbi:MAG: hypothetical protein R3C01_02050 [Planctomycetaceae bacterium]